MKCSRTQRRAVNLLASGSESLFTAFELAKARAHLAACDSCRAYSLEIQVLCGRLRRLEETAPDLEGAGDVHLRLLQAIGPRNKKRIRTLLPGWQWVPPLAAAASIAVALLVTHFHRPPEQPARVAQQPPPDPPPTLWAYNQAARSEKTLDALLRKHGATLLPPDKNSFHSLAFFGVRHSAP